KHVLSVIFIGLQMVNDKQICLTNNEVNTAWEKLTLCAQNQLWMN
ncbi:MAG: hypothetical protein ACI9XC_002590, partial [Gammaproteobacteria bacterium]